MNGWTFNILGSAVSAVAITQGVQQAVFVTLFDNCLVYDYNPTTTTYALGVYNLTSDTQSTQITITTPNEDGPINMLVEGSTLYFGYGSYAGDAAGGQIYSTTNLMTYTLLYTWSSGFQPESIGYYSPSDTLLVSGTSGPNTGIVYGLVDGTATEIESDASTGDATFLAMFNSTMIVAGGTFPQTPIFSNNLATWTSDDIGGIGDYGAPYVFPWSWATELIYGKLWMPAARFTTIYPDESGIASFGGGTGSTSYVSYPSTTDSYYSIADGLVGGTMGLTLGSEASFPGPAIIQPFSSSGTIGPAVFEYGVGGNWAVSSMVYNSATNYVYGALLGQSQNEIILIQGNNGTVVSTSTTTASSNGTGSTNVRPAVANTTLSDLAYSHWSSIANGNLNVTLSEYSPNATLTWIVSPGSANNGAFSGISNITTVWKAFFAANPTLYFNVQNFSLIFTNSSYAKITATLWFVSGSGRSARTLEVPCELDYAYQNRTWSLVGEWWGLPGSPATITEGVARL